MRAVCRARGWKEFNSSLNYRYDAIPIESRERLRMPLARALNFEFFFSFFCTFCARSRVLDRLRARHRERVSCAIVFFLGQEILKEDLLVTSTRSGEERLRHCLSPPRPAAVRPNYRSVSEKCTRKVERTFFSPLMCGGKKKSKAKKSCFLCTRTAEAPNTLCSWLWPLSRPLCKELRSQSRLRTMQLRCVCLVISSPRFFFS